MDWILVVKKGKATNVTLVAFDCMPGKTEIS